MAHFKLDPASSRLMVKVFAGGLLSAFGHNPTLALRDFEGEAQFAPESPDGASLRFRVRPEALEVTGDVKASDRREIENTTRQDVLETGKFPEIVFESLTVALNKAGEGFYNADVTGKLSLHGVTQHQTVSTHISLTGDTLRAHGEFALRQSDYGIRPVSAVGGTLKVKDEVKVTFEMVARRQNERKESENVSGHSGQSD